ncbi:uncharacterized protein [Typha angustifolia]|uniref:uncharacterized protein isoform X2 n=1 Tax=Typha angustifolia TaxID=59011 RepID=UPI003C2D6E6A
MLLSSVPAHKPPAPRPRWFPPRSQMNTKVVGSFFSLAIVSLPVMSAFKRLEVSANKLSKVVSEEVPGTLSSLKLSGLEINDLTSQLNSLRQKISGNQYGKKGRRKKPSFRAGRNNPIIN